MSKIRKLYFYDKPKVLKMISLLNNGASDRYLDLSMFNPLNLLHYLVPLKYKFQPESYVYKDGKDIKALITVTPQKGFNKKVEIKKLLFEENALEASAELVQYAVSRYKAMGSPSILVRVDESFSELIEMFVSKCGFSKISNEKLWQSGVNGGVNGDPNAEYDKNEFRLFRNTDAEEVMNIYNEALLPHFRPLLNCGVSDFKDNIFKGLSYYSEYKYVLVDKNTQKINGCISIQTVDDENYVLDIILNGYFEYDINSIISFASDKIRKRCKNFGLYIRSKRYTNLGEKLDNIFSDMGYKCVQNQIVLTNSSARVLKSEETVKRYNVLTDFYPSNAIQTN